MNRRGGEYNCYEPGLENPSILKRLSRFEKGFLFERLVWSMLDRSHVPNVHNSEFFHSWKKSTGDGYDILVKAGDSVLNVECKFILTKPYSSWIRRDWLSRSCDIIVCNNKWLVSSRDRDLIKSYGFKLMSPLEFLWYIFKISGSLNKLYLNLSPSNRARLLNQESGYKLKSSFKNLNLSLNNIKFPSTSGMLTLKYFKVLLSIPQNIRSIPDSVPASTQKAFTPLDCLEDQSSDRTPPRLYQKSHRREFYHLLPPLWTIWWRLCPVRWMPDKQQGDK